MSKAMMSALMVGMTAAGGLAAVPNSATTAELLPPPPGVHVRHQHTVCWCGPCGCLRVSYVHHRELRSTYGTGFDPRNFDETQPYYYLGPVRAYPRYWVAADPVQ